MKRIEKVLSNCNDKQLLPALQTAGRAALAAGKILTDLYNKPHNIRHKGTIDLVTEADIAAEDAILTILQEEQPDATILAEESHSQYQDIPTGPTWIIDPLDGTTNYAHGFPWYGVSIAYAEGENTLLGVIYCPIQNEMFCACKNNGAWLNAREIKVSDISSLNRSLVATGFPYDIQQNPQEVIAALQSVLTRAQDVRRAGAAALDLAYVACGRLDGFWEIKLKPWDTAAGQLLVEEAGGRLTTFSGGKYTPFEPEVLATNNKIHAELLDVLNNF